MNQSSLRLTSLVRHFFLILIFVSQIQQRALADTYYEEVIVTADFAKTDLFKLPEATTVVSEQQILKRSATHLEQILSFAPNVNFSNGASRGRYFQIRGIGERSQFIDPVNPSVGLVIDGLDMTGLGGAATLFDIQQVEILRGPQGTRFGANALAGLINIKSNDPTEEFEGYLSGRIGNYDTFGIGGAISGSITDTVNGRVAVNLFQTDGYIDNIFLDKDDTNNIDELIARGKLNYQIDDSTQLGVTYLFADIDNGYDAFSLDRNRDTYSDEPGTDSQETHAVALNFESSINDAIDLQALINASQTDVEYSYDEDWAFGQYTFLSDDPVYQPDPCDLSQGPCLAAFDGYSSTDQYLRENNRYSVDLRLLSGTNGKIFGNSSDWVIGIYSLERDEDLTRNYTFAPSRFTSNLKTSSTAVYGELTTYFTDVIRLISGLRLEHWENDYRDNNNVSGGTNETLSGGKLTLEALLDEGQLSYISFARGYKAGGVNSNPDVSEENREFDTEFNYSLELGLKSSWNNRFKTAISAFYIWRKDQQVKSSYAVQDPMTNAISFQDFLSNAAEGTNKGIEIETNVGITDNLYWDLSFGYLDTTFSDYSFQTDDGEFDITGRSQAHSPNYSATTAITYILNETLTFRVEAEAKDEFYFSDSHNLESDSYELLHARIEYTNDNYSIAIYGRNLTDEDYAVRGFGFANDPRDGYSSSGYTQLGEPRLYGLETRINFD